MGRKCVIQVDSIPTYSKGLTGTANVIIKGYLGF